MTSDDLRKLEAMKFALGQCYGVCLAIVTTIDFLKNASEEVPPFLTAFEADARVGVDLCRKAIEEMA